MKALAARILALFVAGAAAALCPAWSNLVARIEPPGGGWYLFKTT
jgi:hypothetical protein